MSYRFTTTAKKSPLTDAERKAKIAAKFGTAWNTFNEQQKAAIFAAERKPISVTVKKNTATGTVSVYGLQRFPVSLYPEQWTVLLNNADAIKAACKS